MFNCPKITSAVWERKNIYLQQLTLSNKSLLLKNTCFDFIKNHYILCTFLKSMLIMHSFVTIVLSEKLKFILVVIYVTFSIT